jgi:hypothetical protein
LLLRQRLPTCSSRKVHVRHALPACHSSCRALRLPGGADLRLSSAAVACTYASLMHRIWQLAAGTAHALAQCEHCPSVPSANIAGAEQKLVPLLSRVVPPLRAAMMTRCAAPPARRQTNVQRSTTERSPVWCERHGVQCIRPSCLIPSEPVASHIRSCACLCMTPFPIASRV